MIYVFDIDGTICNNTYGSYEEAKPFTDRIELINKLYNDGNRIVYFTARGMRSLNGDIGEVYKKYYDLTESQLKKWHAKYHELRLGKPQGDFYIDDKGVNDEDFFRANVRT
jgi:capsule biosynthesis phosphatase